MTDRNRMTLSDRTTALEVKLDQMSQTNHDNDIQTKQSLERLETRLQKMDLNGHATKIKALADATPDLLKIAQVAQTLEAIADLASDRKATQRYIVRRLGLNTRVVRGASAAIFGAICYAFIVQGPVGGWVVTLASHVHL